MTSQYWPEISFYLREIDREKYLFKQKPLTVEAIETLRKNIFHQINQLKYLLLESLEDESISKMLFALSAVLDEEIQRDVASVEMHWPPLSKDFYGEFIAGELFYSMVDEILDSQKVPSIVYEIFYYVLKRGFRGQYRNSKIQISKYLELLQDRIPQNEDVKVQPVQTIRRPLGRLRLKRKHYYQAAAGCVVLVGASLYLISNLT